MSPSFCSELDRSIAASGPAGLFKFNSDGELAYDNKRSRRLREDNKGPIPLKHIHCLLIDRKTLLPQYALITSTALTEHIGDCTLEIFPTILDALNAVEQQKNICYSR